MNYLKRKSKQPINVSRVYLIFQVFIVHMVFYILKWFNFCNTKNQQKYFFTEIHSTFFLSTFLYISEWSFSPVPFILIQYLLFLLLFFPSFLYLFPLLPVFLSLNCILFTLCFLLTLTPPINYWTVYFSLSLFCLRNSLSTYFKYFWYLSIMGSWLPTSYWKVHPFS